MKLELCGPQLNATSTGGPRPRGGVPGDLHGPSGGTESGRAVGGAAERCGAGPVSGSETWWIFLVKPWENTMEQKQLYGKKTIWEKHIEQ